MSKSVPAPRDLVAVVSDFLEGKLLPTLSADLWFECKVAINILGIVRRELELGEVQESAGHERLVELLGADGSVEELNQQLADAVRSGEVRATDDLIDHLRVSIEDALRINNPKWLKAE